VSESGSSAALAAAIAGLVALLAAALAAAGIVLSARERAAAAADAAALAAAPVTFRPFGSTSGPTGEAGRLSAEHGAELLRCRCPVDRSWRSRVVEVEVAVTVEAFGAHTVRAVSRAEFDPVQLLEPASGNKRTDLRQNPSMAAGATPATAALAAAGVDYVVHEYGIATGGASSYGEAVAAALRVEAERVFKTLVAEVDGKPIVAIVPVAGQLDLKALARARGGKRAAMAPPAGAERLTGYVVGGISPFGQKRRLPVVVDESVLGHETVYVSGGRRGIQLEVAPQVLLSVAQARPAPIAG
jgi:Cys-tRNA(Pro)/Cys-tRNA(Cys) deacylase